MKSIPSAFRTKGKSIVLLLLDVDGVLTDGRIIIDDRGVETKHFHVRDGQGIALLFRGGIEVGFVTARNDGVLLVSSGIAELAPDDSFQCDGGADPTTIELAVTFVEDDAFEGTITLHSGDTLVDGNSCPDERVVATGIASRQR